MSVLWQPFEGLRLYKWTSDWHVPFMVLKIQEYPWVPGGHNSAFCTVILQAQEVMLIRNTKRSSGMRWEKKGFQKKISRILSIMVMELYFFPDHTIHLVCKYQETNQFIQNFFFSKSSLLRSIIKKKKGRENETLEMLAMLVIGGSFISPILFFPRWLSRGEKTSDCGRL